LISSAGDRQSASQNGEMIFALTTRAIRVNATRRTCRRLANRNEQAWFSEDARIIAVPRARDRAHHRRSCVVEFGAPIFIRARVESDKSARWKMRV
jgi:hypothetical protein